MGGLSQVLGGRLIDLSKGLTGHIFFVPLDPYTALFAGSIVLPVIGAVLLSRIRADSRYSVPEFAGMFLQGECYARVRGTLPSGPLLPGCLQDRNMSGYARLTERTACQAADSAALRAGHHSRENAHDGRGRAESEVGLKIGEVQP